MAFPFSPDTDKLAESRENLAKMREDQAIAKIELAADVTQGQINEATTYQIAPGDIEGSDKPKTPQEQVEEDFRMDLRTLREYQNPQKEEAYHKLYNAPHLRAKYDKYLAGYEAELDELRKKETGYTNEMDKRGDRGKGVGEKEAQEAKENGLQIIWKIGDMEKKIRHLKHLLAPENEMSHFCEYNNKNQKVKDWEKAHQMEIIEDKDYGTIDVFHNGESVSNLGYMDNFKSVPMQALNAKGMVFIYADEEKEGNVIEYYEKDAGGLMQKTETSGTRELFKIDRSKLVSK
jgi:hypothetical protein